MDVPYLTSSGMTSMSTLLYPLVWLLEKSKMNHLNNAYTSNKLTLLHSDIHLVTSSLFIQQYEPFVGLVFHRIQTTQCYDSKIEEKNSSNSVSNFFFL